MSWSIYKHGAPEEVKTYVRSQKFHNDVVEDRHFEQAKEIICDMIDKLTDSPNFVSVVASGSEGKGWMNSCNITVRPDQRKVSGIAQAKP